MNPPVVSVVIVNYNAGKYLRRCLRSLSEQTCRDIQVIVVDNASSDGSMDTIADLPGMTRIPNAANRGFAAGQNQGIAAASGTYLLALNYDLELAPDFIEQLVAALETAPEAGWACGRMVNMLADGTRLNTLYAAGHRLAANRFSFLRGHGEPGGGRYEEACPVFGAPGAAALYRREFVFDLLMGEQFFDERFFTWYEDVDVDWRGQRAEWQCLYVPAAVAYHVGHVDEEYPEPYRSWRARLGIRNRWLLIAANDNLPALWRDRGALLRYELSSVLYVVRVGLARAYLSALLQLVRDIPYIVRRRRTERAARSRQARAHCPDKAGAAIGGAADAR